MAPDLAHHCECYPEYLSRRRYSSCSHDCTGESKRKGKDRMREFDHLQVEKYLSGNGAHQMNNRSLCSFINITPCGLYRILMLLSFWLVQNLLAIRTKSEGFPTSRE